MFTTKEQEGGTGLGLFVVRQIIEEYQGSIIIDPKNEPGAVFVITLKAESPLDDAKP